MLPLYDNTNTTLTSDEEKMAQDLVEQGQIDQAIDLYQQLRPESARIYRVIGMLYAEKKGRFDLAISCYEQALHIHELNGEDTTDILSKLGSAYQHLREFDTALAYHTRSLNLRQAKPDIDQKLIADNLFGIANAYWGQNNLSEALIYAQQSLALSQSRKCPIYEDIAAGLAVLANIYHACGDDIRALELVKEAVAIFESRSSPESVLLVSTLNNMATIQVSAGLFDDALLTFIRALHICERTVSEGHPKRIAINNNIQRVIQMHQQNGIYSFSHLWELLTKFLLF